MRKTLVLVGIILVQAVLLAILLPKVFAANSIPTHANCLQITVKFNAPAAWLKSSNNRSIQIGCSGAIKPTGAQSCQGGIQTLKPGQTKTLGDCDCFHSAGCLVVGKTLKKTTDTKNNKYVVSVDKPLSGTLNGGKCSVTYVNRNTKKKIKLASICGTNEKRFNIGLNIKCTTPKPSVTPEVTITPTPGVSVTPTPGVSVTPTPGECVAPKPVTNVKVTCPSCFGPTQGPTPTPLPPTPTPIVAQEGFSCGPNAGQAGDLQCASGLVCTNVNANGVGVCESQPTPTTGGSQ